MALWNNRPENNGNNGSGSDAAPQGDKKPVSLGGLYGLIAESQRQIADYLVRREAELRAASAGSVASSGDGGKFDAKLLSDSLIPVIERLDAIGNMLANGAASVGSGGMFPEDLAKMLDERLGRLEGLLTGDLPMPEAVPSMEPQAEVYPEESHSQMEVPQVRTQMVAGSNAKLERVIFGDELTGNPALRQERQTIMGGLFGGYPECAYLAGVLLMFRSSAPEKMVLLLKDLGEAFYRWAATYGGDYEPMEDALCSWAERMCEGVGLQNSIELVRPGNRFDSSRHNATSRGVEVTQVHGWIILRGNGTVYAKAMVDVQ
ncbi:MAG: hypothetical protein Q4D98_00520 [Planctomycetia bacterium]|nr:hypothetical protein [Planctomycetia bacterium]